GLVRQRTARRELQVPARGRDDLVAPPGARPVRGSDVLADAQSSHALQMMSVAPVDGALVVERGDEEMRGHVLRRREAHWNADLMREKKPSRGGCTASPRISANCASTSASSC